MVLDTGKHQAILPLAARDRPPQTEIDIEAIIRDGRLTARFQPIVSVAQRSICGVEGLIRGVNPDSADLISPLELFHTAMNQGLQVELDRACRDTIVRTFEPVYRCRKDTLLFINLHSSILDKVAGSNHLLDMVQEYRINPCDIVIEFNESAVEDMALLKKFVDTYRQYGFLIAMDDVGCGFSNLSRISLVKPDIVKTDMSLTRNICTDFYVQEVFRALVKLSNKIGALVVAEGVETEDEAVQILGLGAHMIQGYYISRPQKIEDTLSGDLGDKLGDVVERLKIMEKYKTVLNKEKYSTLNLATTKIAARLSTVSRDRFDEELANSINGYEGIECAYVLDERGVQASATVFSNAVTGIKKSRLFSPAASGADHSLKVYYRNLKNAGLQRYLTEPYASLASGNLCRTFTRTFLDRRDEPHILCIDFKINGTEC
ncbi:MAG: EAL domain-containing protein [Dehalococcoidales bacterium]|jgi:EAL domain-containing protein (putative c-di-GMP-specific phosphodiesterase class I)